MQNSLLRFLKTFHKYLPYTNFEISISLVQFFGEKIAQILHKANCSDKLNSLKIALQKYLANAKFSPRPNVASGKNPLYNHFGRKARHFGHCATAAWPRPWRPFHWLLAEEERPFSKSSVNVLGLASTDRTWWRSAVCSEHSGEFFKFEPFNWNLN